MIRGRGVGASATLACALVFGAGPQTIRAQPQEDTTARFQVTYNWQRHPSFDAAYSGTNSLSARAERMYTFSATAHLGLRPWSGGELYLNPEVVQGIPFSGNLVGLGGFTNGEITRAAGSNPSIYRQRLFLRQTWNHGGGTQQVDADLNQMAGHVDRDRFVLTIGNFSTLDVFDDNAYAKDPRTQFMNWGHWTYAAFDYAADARGFGWGFAGAWHRGDWALRFGRMTGPRTPNGLSLDYALGRHYGDQIELEHSHRLFDRPGKLRVLAWRNRAVLAAYSDALRSFQTSGHPQALAQSRESAKVKYGLGLNVEQAFSPELGAFLRAMKADGRTETHAFTEVDASLSTGVLMDGAAWGRPGDSAGLAFGRHWISPDRRRYLEAGGISYFIGDGGLRDRPESNLEVFYSLQAVRGVWMTGGYQRIHNPAYNAARGPVNVMAIRLHTEF